MSSSTDSSKAKVSILGTYHFGNGGEHAVNVDIADVLSSRKQQEILHLLEKLMEFRPDKIAVEAPAESFGRLNKLYEEYCQGSYQLERNEIYQLGFRLAKSLGHEKIYPIDVPSSIPSEPVFEYMQKNLPEMYEKFEGEIIEYGNTFKSLQESGTMIDIFKHLNNPERYSREHSDWYLKFAQIGAGDTYIGADLLLAWYNRNIRIFANLQRISEPGDRVLAIYGAGHMKILSEFVSDYSGMELAQSCDYLG